MNPLAIATAYLLALQGQAEPAQPTPMPPPTVLPPPVVLPTESPPRMMPPLASPPSEAQVERFLASLPAEVKTGTPAMKLAPESVKRLIALNPGKEAQIEAILSAFGKCSQPAVVAGMERVHRMLARSPLLGPEKLERLTAFFDGGGWASLTAIADRINKSATPSAADLAEREQLMAAYPLEDLAISLQIASLNAVHQGAFVDAKKCEDERNAALAKAGIENPLEPLFGS